MKHLTIRDIPPDLARALTKEVRQRGQSLNQTVKELLARALGLEGGGYDNGLGRLAGTWSSQELDEFERATSQFEQVDAEQWE